MIKVIISTRSERETALFPINSDKIHRDNKYLYMHTEEFHTLDMEWETKIENGRVRIEFKTDDLSKEAFDLVAEAEAGSTVDLRPLILADDEPDEDTL